MAHATVTTGGWYWRGDKVRAGDPIEASAAQIAAWAESGYVRARVAPVGRADAPEAAATQVPAWPHKMAPDQYLHRFPTGPDADLARAVMGEA